MATTRPEASETTGTLRAISGVTVPVTTNSEFAGRSTPAARGNCSGCSTVNRAGSAPGTIFACGGASAAGSACAVQPTNGSNPNRERTKKKRSSPAVETNCRRLLRFRSHMPSCHLRHLRLELHHDRVSQAGFIFPHIGTETRASSHTSEARCGRQEWTRHECCGSYDRSSTWIGNGAGSAIDARRYPTTTRPVRHVRVAIPILCAEGDVLFRHPVKGERSVPGFVWIPGVLREIG